MDADLPEPGSPADWLRHARSDLTLASTPLAGGVLLEHLLFHTQQAAEKALKAVIVARGVRPPKTHDLTKLLDRIGDAPAEAWSAADLSKYVVVVRYPADLGEVDEAEHARAVALAFAVMAWAGQVIATES